MSEGYHIDHICNIAMKISNVVSIALCVICTRVKHRTSVEPGPLLDQIALCKGCWVLWSDLEDTVRIRVM